MVSLPGERLLTLTRQERVFRVLLLGVAGHEAASGQHPHKVDDPLAHRHPGHPIRLAVVRTGRRGDEVDPGAALLSVERV